MRFRAFTVHPQCLLEDNSRVYQLFLASWAATIATYTCSSTVEFLHARTDDDGLGAKEAALQATVTSNVRIADIVLQVLDDVGCGKFHRTQSTSVSIQQQIVPGAVSDGEWALQSPTSSPLQSSDSSDGETDIRSPVPSANRSEFQMTISVTHPASPRVFKLDFLVPNTPHARVLNMMKSFEIILNKSLASSDVLVSEIELCGPEDLAQIASWNWTIEADMDRQSTSILDCLSKHAVSEPDRPAVDSWDGKLSYAELDDLSSKLADHLLELGLQGSTDTTYVPLLFEKSLLTVVSILATMKLGCAFVLLDPSQPLNRLQTICNELNPFIVICSEKLPEVAKSLSSRILVLNSNLCTAARAFSNEKSPSSTSLAYPTYNHPLYVVFTSGSTGTPKGVVISHQSFLSCASAYVEKVGMSKNDRIFQFASYAFDVSISDMLNAMIAGACICIPSDEERSSRISEGVRRLKPTWADLTPSLLRHLSKDDIPTVQTVVVSGEAMSADVVEAWQSHVRLINVYGPAECSVSSTVRTTLSPENAANIGHAIVGSNWIVDPSDHERLVPVGAVGELLIGGPHLGQGYINEPAKTRSTFAPAPSWLAKHFCQHNSSDDTRLYCTGDLVQYQSDGSLRYVGRKDTQVKLRGQRVELAEVEHHVRECFPPGTTIHAEVAGIDQAHSAAKSLVAYVTEPLSHHLEDRESCPSGSIFVKSSAKLRQDVSVARKKLEESVPDYMIPAIFLSTPRLPLVASGKVDRKALREAVSRMSRDDLKHYAINSQQEAPSTLSTPLEQTLLGIFARVLNISPDALGPSDDFFAIGGDSITAMRAVAQCRQEGLYLETAAVLRHRVISKIAAEVKFDMSVPQGLSQYPPHEDPINTPFGLSPVQEMFFADSPDGDNYFNQSFFVAVTRDIDLQHLSSAARTVVERHSMLRARFTRSQNGTWTQRVTDDVQGSVRVQEHRISNRGQVTDIMSTTQRSLNIKTGPIVSFDLIRIDGDSPYLFINTHHAVIDLVSYRILLNELEELLNGENFASQDLPTSFQWWSRLQRAHSETKLQPEVALPVSLDIDNAMIDRYWALRDVTNCYGNSRSTPLLIDEESTKMVFTTANQTFGTEPVELLHAALLHSFMKVFSDRSAPTLFNEGHGRESWDPSIDLSQTVGWFTTIWPTPVDFEQYRRNDVLDLVRRVKDGRRKVPGKGMPYFASRYLNPHGKEVFAEQKMEIVFNFHGQFQQFEREDSLFQNVTWDYEHTTDYGPETILPGLFEITCVVVQNRLQFEFIYSKSLAHQDSIIQWTQECGQSLREIGERLSSSPVGLPTLTDLPLLSLGYQDVDSMAARLAEIAISWSDVEDIYPCRPMQEGILLSQTREDSLYRTGSVLQFRNPTSQAVDIDKLYHALVKVTDRHSMLRTFNLPSDLPGQSFQNVVLKSNARPTVFSTLTYEPFGDERLEKKSMLEIIRQQRQNALPPTHAGYQVKFFESSDHSSVFCYIEFNHAIMDGWSSKVLFQDWVKAYNDCLPTNNPVQYKDYVSYVGSLEPCAAYWNEYLAKAECCLFPVLSDHGDETQTHIYNTDVVLPIPDHSIGNWLRAHGISGSNLFHVAWGLLLRAYLGSDDVCFGYLTSGRDAPIPGVEDAVGLFANLLPCRMMFSGSSSPISLLKDSQEDLAQGLSHQKASFAEMLACLDLNGQPLFNTVVSIQSQPAENETFEVSREGLQVEELEELDPTEYALALNVHFKGDKVRVYVSARAPEIPQWQARNIADTLSRIVSEIVAKPDETITNMQLTGEFQSNTLKEWNYRMPFAVNHCVHDLIQKQALMRQGESAVCAWDGDFSYRELDERSSLAAQLLCDMGVKPGDWVSILIERSKWVPVAMLAAMKSGAAFVLMEQSHPTARLQQTCEDLGAHIIFTSQHLLEKAQAIRSAVIVMDHINYQHSPLPPTRVSGVTSSATPSATSSHGSTSSRGTTSPHDALYAVFTSGSTGNPKGIVISHGAFASSAFAHAPIAGYSAQARVFQFSSYAFDACMAEIMTTLLVGGTICIPSEHDRWNDMPGAVARYQANHIFMAPSMLRTLDPAQLPSIKTLLVGGEPLSSREIEKWSNSLKLIQMYGPSECAVYCAATTPLTGDSDPRDIGHLMGARPWIVDPKNPEVLSPLGAVGELLIEGPIVGSEYLNKPEQTAASFIDPPTWWHGFSCYPTRKIYRTGDLVQYAREGTLRIIGRKDTQVKLRGQRIELGEIEHRLASLIPQCLYIIVELVHFEDSDRPTELVALLNVAGDEAKSDTSLCREQKLMQPCCATLSSHIDRILPRLSNQLPYYMIPNAFFSIEKVPFSAGGKIDRKTLRREAATLIQTGYITSKSEEPAALPTSMTTAEHEMLQLVSKILCRQVNSLRPGDNFFKVGGDSLRAMKLASLARSCGIKISVQDIFRAPQISAMAAAIQSENTVEEKPNIPMITPFSLLPPDDRGELIQDVLERTGLRQSDIEDMYPCTPLQEGLISLGLRSPGAYMTQSTYVLPPDCDLTRLRTAWMQVVHANPVLRTRIIQTDQCGMLQFVVSLEPVWKQADNLANYLKNDRESVMCLDDPLFRLALITDPGSTNASESKRNFLAVTMHHAIYDGWSESLILGQVEAAYAGHSIKRQAFTPFVKYIQDTKHLAKEFWRSEFACVDRPSVMFPSVDLPNHQACPSSFMGGDLSLMEAHKSSSFTISTQIRLAWALVMSHFTTSDVVTFGMIVNGRNAEVPGIEDMAGPTIATLPCRMSLDSSKTVESLLSEIQQDSARVAPYEQFGLQNISALSESAAEECRFQNLFVIQASSTSEESSLLRPIDPSEFSDTSAAFDTYPLTLQCEILQSTVHLQAIYDDQIISSEMMSSVLRQFEHVFEELAHCATLPVAQISTINPGDVKLLEKWSLDQQKCEPQASFVVHDLIQQKSQSQPTISAIHAWDGDLSYYEIDQLSTALAIQLVNVGVGVESTVPVCFEKSKSLAVIMIAILKCGAAFVLLDPSSQPLQRLQYIVESVGGRIFVASENYASLSTHFAGTQSVIVFKNFALPAPESTPSAQKILPTVGPQNALYTIFTSGSTGKPKGVVIEHGGYCAGNLSRQKITGLDSESRVLQFSSVSFDAFITDILDTLIAGGCVCIPSESERNAHLGQVAHEMRVTHADLVPSVARTLNPSQIPTLKMLALSGEPMATTDITTWADRVRLCNLYGPAECSAVATGQIVSGIDSNPSNIGKVCGGTAWVVSPADHSILLPIGCIGELVIEGPIVGRGYLGGTQASSSSNFLQQPPTWRSRFPQYLDCCRMYKTGDLVQYNGDGSLRFVGRKDQQVKLHGQRLELGDVEHQLRVAFPAAHDTVADVVESAPGTSQKRLVAFVALCDMREQEDQQKSQVLQNLANNGVHILCASEFRKMVGHAEAMLREQLPGYMVPTLYFPLRTFPRAPSGKVDRRRLKQAASELMTHEGLDSFTAAREKRPVSTVAEKKLQAIWAKLLGRDASSIGAEDGFLHLGGDSITAMKAASMAASEGLHLSIPKMFQNESLQSLARTDEEEEFVQLIDWAQEAALPLDLLSTSRASQSQILLTGSTGLLGSEILQQLIECPDITMVHCVAVRDPARIPQHPKVTVYHGDLDSPRLGLTEEEAERLQECTAIIHCGARVSFVQNYETMRAVNVHSTMYLARLALKSSIPFHFISTAGVGNEGEDVLEEISAAASMPPADGEDGYTASKWVSEVFLENLHAKFNLPVVIHRPSNILKEGSPGTDLVNNLLTLSRRMAIVPRLTNWQGFFDLVGIKTVASNIVGTMMASIQQRSEQGKGRGEIRYFHESGETVFPVDSLNNYLETIEQVPFKTVELNDWIERALQNGMDPLIGDFLNGIAESGTKIYMPPIRSCRQL